MANNRIRYRAVFKYRSIGLFRQPLTINLTSSRHCSWYYLSLLYYSSVRFPFVFRSINQSITPSIVCTDCRLYYMHLDSRKLKRNDDFILIGDIIDDNNHLTILVSLPFFFVIRVCELISNWTYLSADCIHHTAIKCKRETKKIARKPSVGNVNKQFKRKKKRNILLIIQLRICHTEDWKLESDY